MWPLYPKCTVVHRPLHFLSPHCTYIYKKKSLRKQGRRNAFFKRGEGGGVVLKGILQKCSKLH